MPTLKVQSFHILEMPDGVDALRKIEAIGRVCWKSEDRTTDDSSSRFVKMLIDKGHESVLEHCSITVSITTDIGVARELIRHRLCSFTQESTRYVNYSSKSIRFIHRPEVMENEAVFFAWSKAMDSAEEHYNNLISLGLKPEIARDVLPMGTATELVITANFRQWRTMFKQRTTKAAHPGMRALMRALCVEFKESIPVIFDDITWEES